MLMFRRELYFFLPDHYHALKYGKDASILFRELRRGRIDRDFKAMACCLSVKQCRKVLKKKQTNKQKAIKN